MRRALLLLAFVAVPVAAAERDLCPERPGLNTPPCVLDRGRVQVETALADWTLTRDATGREDQVLIGDTLLRIGVTDTVELQLGWTPLGFDRQRTGPLVDRATRIGDVAIGAKVNLANPDGSGFSAAIRPQVTLPVGRQPIGAGDWSAGLAVPLSYELSDAVQLAATPEVDAAVDEDGRGRHLAYGATVGMNLALSDKVSSALEVQAIRDRDPAGHTDPTYAGVSLAWQASSNLQLDIGSAFGLNHDSSDVELYAGVSKRF